MNPKSKTILFFGTEDFSLISLRALVDDGFNVAGVITKPDSRKSRSKKLLPPAVKLFATENNITVHQPTTTNEMRTVIEKYSDPIGVLVSYGRIIPKEIIDLFSPGIINIHPSLLPKYRGPSPIESAIINGDTKTGVTIMQLQKAMDAGPIYIQEELPLRGNETQSKLYETLGRIGAELLVATLPKITDGTLQPYTQDENKASYCSLLSKNDTYINKDEATAQEIDRHIRAYAKFPKTRVDFYDETRIITKATPTKTPSERTINCKNDTTLEIIELVGSNGRTMPIEAFLNGIKNKKTS